MVCRCYEKLNLLNRRDGFDRLDSRANVVNAKNFHAAQHSRDDARDGNREAKGAMHGVSSDSGNVGKAPINVSSPPGDR